jgi:hypothetical protein
VISISLYSLCMDDSSWEAADIWNLQQCHEEVYSANCVNEMHYHLPNLNYDAVKCLSAPCSRQLANWPEPHKSGRDGCCGWLLDVVEVTHNSKSITINTLLKFLSLRWRAIQAHD